MIISIDSETAFDRIQHHFLIKNSQQLGIEETHLNIIKVMYDKSTANIIVNRERLKAFPLREGTSRMPTLTTLIQHNTGETAEARRAILLRPVEQKPHSQEDRQNEKAEDYVPDEGTR